VEYTLTVTNHSRLKSCTLSVPLALQLLGRRGQPLPTHVTEVSSRRSPAVRLAPGQWAQAVSQLSPDLAGPGEPMRGNCEPDAYALRITTGGASLQAPMDPTPVCQQGAIQFDRLRAVARTPRCSANSLRGSFQREFPPFAGSAPYTLTLRNERGRPCHTETMLGLRLLGSRGGKLATRVRHGISSPYVLGAHALGTAAVMLRTKPSRGARCDRLATRLGITPSRGAGTLTTRIRPPLSVCDGGLIELSALFLNG
jgi:hypothetical protein